MPAPLTPADCDLQDFPFMPLHVARLRDSDLAAEEHPEACWYAVMLWAASWHQLPAGSLPDNETVLARLCGLGRDLKTFRKHKADAMRGFVLCDDGRLYHPVVAEQALAAWESKKQQRWRSECARIKKANQRNGTSIAAPTYEQFLEGVSPQTIVPEASSVPGDTPVCPPGQVLQETGTGTGISKKDAIASSVFAEPKTEAAPQAAKGRKAPTVGPPDFEAAWKAYPHVEGRSSKPNALTHWRKLSDEERAGLTGAVERFKPKVAKTCGDRGAPDMARWLKDGKHLNWMEPPTSAAPAVTFDGPPELYASVVKAAGDDFARKWLMPCRWRPSDRTLVARNSLTAKKLSTELSVWLRDMNVRVELASGNEDVAREVAA